MRRVYRAGIAVALSTAVPAFAQTKQTGITYDCDTAADHLSELILPAPETPFTVTGRVQLNKIAVSGKYAPITRLQISSSSPGGDRSAEKVAGFEITALPAKAVKPSQKNDDAVLQFLGWDERPNVNSQSNDLSNMLKYSGSLPFSLFYNGSYVAIKIGKQEKIIQFADSHPVVRLICSTGEFLYTELKVEPMP